MEHRERRIRRRVHRPAAALTASMSRSSCSGAMSWTAPSLTMVCGLDLQRRTPVEDWLPQQQPLGPSGQTVLPSHSYEAVFGAAKPVTVKTEAALDQDHLGPQGEDFHPGSLGRALEPSSLSDGTRSCSMTKSASTRHTTGTVSKVEQHGETRSAATSSDAAHRYAR